jgi:hypothetical protein
MARRLLNLIPAAAAAAAAAASTVTYSSVLGDPGMKAETPSTSWCGWSFCNGALAPAEYSTWSPRMADCDGAGVGPGPNGNAVSLADEALTFPSPIPGHPEALTDVNAYAIAKEQYLASVCGKNATSPAGKSWAWSAWGVMFKSGNMNTAIGICNSTNTTTAPVPAADASPVSFDNGPMNQPLTVHGWTQDGQPLPYNSTGKVGYFAGTYDVNASWTPAEVAAVEAALHSYTQAWMAFRIAEIAAEGAGVAPPPQPTAPAPLAGLSYLASVWWRNVSSASFNYLNLQATSPAYPWLMNYLRSNQMGSPGGYGGYPWAGAGLMNGALTGIGSRLRVGLQMLNLSAASYSAVHFYFPCYGGCWKTDGSPCDGESLTSDVTKYVCFQLDAVPGGCSPKSLGGCPPIHYFLNGTTALRNETTRFPYECYSGAAPSWTTDRYSNPNPQELLMLVPCAEWGLHGAPASPGEGWTRGPYTWDIDVGTLGARLFLYGVNPQPTAEMQERMRRLARAVRERQEEEARSPVPLPPSSLPTFPGWDGLARDELPPYPGWGRTWLDFEVGPEEFSSTHGIVTRWEVSGWDVVVADV